MAEAPCGTGDRDDGPVAARRRDRFPDRVRDRFPDRVRDRFPDRFPDRFRAAGPSGRCGGMAQPSANLALSFAQRAALPDNVGGRDPSILPERQQ